MPGELFHISRTCIQDFLSKLPFRLVDPFRVKSCDISYRTSPKMTVDIVNLIEHDLAFLADGICWIRFGSFHPKMSFISGMRN